MLVKLLAACLVIFVIGRMSVVYVGMEKQDTNPRFVAKGVEVTPPPEPKAQTGRSVGVRAGVESEDRRPIEKPLCGLSKPCKRDEMAIGLASGPDADSASICVDGLE